MLDPTETQTRRHLWLTLFAVLALVAAVAVTLISGRGRVSGSNTPSLIDSTLNVSTLHSAHLACPRDPAFSPDGSRLAVFGVLASSLPDGSSGSSCTALATSSAAYALEVFDTTSGEPIRVISLDSQLLEGLGAGADEDIPQIAYSGLGWSPDGMHVAFAFTAFAGAARTPENVLDSGLLLVDVTSGRMTIIPGDSGFFATAGGVSSGFPLWRLPQQSELPSYTPPSALAYTWGADGMPQPLVPLTGALSELPAEAGPRYPVGTPDGGSRYTLWQPGLVIGGRSLDGTATQNSFVTAFPAWSPDGTHVTLMVAGVTLNGGPAAPAKRANATAPPPPPLPSPIALPLVPPRDAALAAVQQQVSDTGWTEVAWNTDGSLLASTNCTTGRDQRIEIRDTATGQVLARETLGLGEGDMGCAAGQQSSTMGAYPDLALSLQWSPGGNRLLVTDCTAGTLTFYHVRKPSGATGGQA